MFENKKVILRIVEDALKLERCKPQSPDIRTIVIDEIEKTLRFRLKEGVESLETVRNEIRFIIAEEIRMKESLDKENVLSSELSDLELKRRNPEWFAMNKKREAKKRIKESIASAGFGVDVIDEVFKVLSFNDDC